MPDGSAKQTTQDFPRKLFYRINEVAEIVGVEAYVLRYWETRFPMLKPERMGNDERRYRQKDVEILLQIRQLLHREKFTIAGAVEKMSGKSRPTAEPPASRSAILDEITAPAANLFDGGIEAARRQLMEIRRELVDLRDCI